MAAKKLLAAMLSVVGLASIASADTGPRLSIFGVHVGEMARQRKVSVDEAVSAVRSWGFEAADLWFSEGEMPVNARLLAGGLKPASLVLFMDYAYTNDVESADAAIAYAKSVGSPRIMLVPGYVRKGDDRSEARKRMLPNLRDFMRRATAAGIQVDFEDFDASNALVGSQSDLRETFAAVPELGHVLDTGNYIFWHDDVLSAQREFASRIRHVHIKDRPQGDLKQSTAAGTGVIPVREILANLRAANYGGWITVEDFGSTNMWDDVRISAEYLRKTWNSVNDAAPLEIGWGEVDITPPFTKKIPLDGQYYERIATGVHTPLSFVALAVRSGDEYFITASIDNLTIQAEWLEKVRAELKARIPDFDPKRLTINCIHTHCAPTIGGYSADLPEASLHKVGSGSLWDPEAYSSFATPRIVDALVAAWRNLEPGSIARAKGEASIGHSRIALYRDGHGEMYGDTKRADFVGMASGEDPNVEMLFTYDAQGKWTGAIFNVACPAQVMEATYLVSGDIAGVLRGKMREVNGKDFHVIYQPAAAGCQSPRDLVRGYADTTDGWHADTCERHAENLRKCAMNATVAPRQSEAVVKYDHINLKLPRRRVSMEEVAESAKELEELRAKRSDEAAFADFLAELHANEQLGGPGPYDSKLHPFVLAEVAKGVLQRSKDQVTNPEVDVEVNVFRLGDIAFATCPFELYLVYGQIIKARSAAKQTFIVELCNGDHAYLPSDTVIKSRSYGSGVNNGEVGPEGGFRLADEIAVRIGRLF